MAKRKRLTPAQPGFLETKSATPGLTPGFAAQQSPDPGAPSPAPSAPSAPSAPPIAQVARDSAASAALAEVAAELESARTEGRLIQALPLSSIRRDHLVRDRLIVDPDEMIVLKQSLRSRGQQTPIEVVDLGPEAAPRRYGLISGWRRLTALDELHGGTGEARFGTVQAILRSPETAEAAYTAMVEENEIRVALSPYERARIVAKSVEQGVFPSHKQALQTLFAAASRAKRSKIGSFLPVVAALDGVLAHPAALTERLGLRLSKLLEDDPDLGRDWRVRLRKAEFDEDDPTAEIAWLEAAATEAETGVPADIPAATALPVQTVTPPATPTATPAPAPAPTGSPVPEASAAKPAPAPSTASEGPQEIIKGVYLEQGGGFIHKTLTLSGPKVDEGFKARLIAWLQG
jgi:ParB-like chromosome segregation protein Spo0J